MPRMATTMPATPLPDYQGSTAAAPRHSSGTSIGPFFAVLAVILVLTLLSCIFGRVCAAQAEGPDEWYDCTRWARRRCWWSVPRRTVRRGEAKEQPAAALALPEP